MGIFVVAILSFTVAALIVLAIKAVQSKASLSRLAKAESNNALSSGVQSQLDELDRFLAETARKDSEELQRRIDDAAARSAKLRADTRDGINRAQTRHKRPVANTGTIDYSKPTHTDS